MSKRKRKKLKKAKTKQLRQSRFKKPFKKVFLKRCDYCGSTFIGSIDPYGRFCSIRCKIALAPSVREEAPTKESVLREAHEIIEHERETDPAWLREAKRKQKYDWKWAELRYAAFKLYGKKCMCCGSIERLEVDHIKPKSKYPELKYEFDNLQILCKICNIGKSNKDETDWRKSICQK